MKTTDSFTNKLTLVPVVILFGSVTIDSCRSTNGNFVTENKFEFHENFI